MYGNPTTKELKKHLSRLVGGTETGSLDSEDVQKVMAGGPGQATWQLVYQDIPHLHADKPGGTTGE